MTMALSRTPPVRHGWQHSEKNKCPAVSFIYFLQNPCSPIGIDFPNLLYSDDRVIFPLIKKTRRFSMLHIFSNKAEKIKF